MGDALDLDEVIGTLRRTRRRGSGCRRSTAGCGSGRGDRASTVDLLAVEHDAVPPRPAAGRPTPASAVTPLRSSISWPTSVPARGRPRRGPFEEPLPFVALDGVRRVDGRHHQRDVGEAGRDERVGRRQPIEPTGVDVPVTNVRAVQQVEEERLVGRPAVDDDGRVGRARATAAPAPRGDRVPTR